MENTLKQQVEVTVKLTFWLDAVLEQEQIWVYAREGLYAGFKDQAEFMEGQTMVDILEIREEAQIYGVAEMSPERDSLTKYNNNLKATLKATLDTIEEVTDLMHYKDGLPVTALEGHEIERAYTSLVSVMVQAHEAIGGGSALKEDVAGELISLVEIFDRLLFKGQVSGIHLDMLQELSARNKAAIAKAKENGKTS